MGGTSTDVCAIVDGAARRESERLVGGLPVRLPTLAVHTVGAGGGSVVWLDEGGALRVGPESAGADPGPACYGKGGTRATVTDANLLLGRLPSTLPGGIVLDLEAAERALGDVDPAGVIDVVDAEMVRALRVVSVEQGLDPRDFALVAFGGAGPLHACALADELEMSTVLVPAAAGVLSALGLVAADERRDTVRTYVEPPRTSPRDRSVARALGRGGSSLPGPVLRAARAARATSAKSGSTWRTRTGTATPTASGRSSSSRCGLRRSGPRRRSRVSGRPLTATGPQVLELDGATAWIPEGWSGETDPHGTLILRRAR